MEILGQYFEVVSVMFTALAVGLIVQLLVKPAMDSWGPDTADDKGKKKRDVIINGVSILLGWLVSWLASVYAGQVLGDPSSAAEIFFRGLFGTGFAVLGYEGLGNLWGFISTRNQQGQ